MTMPTQGCKPCWVLSNLSARMSEDESPVTASVESCAVGFGATTRLSTTKVQHSTAACVESCAVGLGGTTRLSTTKVQHSTAACVESCAVGLGATTRLSTRPWCHNTTVYHHSSALHCSMCGKLSCTSRSLEQRHTTHQIMNTGCFVYSTL